jgi:hypothetical protein
MPNWIENTELSPGVRRMQATVGQEVPFDLGRQQMKLLADLEVTTKGVERTAETIGEHVAARDREEIQRAVQLDLPMQVGEAVPILYVQMDGTGVPVVKKETAGRQGKMEGQPSHTREAKLGCVFTQTAWDQEGFPIRDPDSTIYSGAIETAEEFGKRIYVEAWKRGWSRHLDSLQIEVARLAASAKDNAQELIYVARDFLEDRFGRFFSSSVCSVWSTGRKRQIFRSALLSECPG